MLLPNTQPIANPIKRCISWKCSVFAEGLFDHVVVNGTDQLHVSGDGLLLLGEVLLVEFGGLQEEVEK
jgi:hypothetical protein